MLMDLCRYPMSLYRGKIRRILFMNKEIDFDRMIEIIHDASITFGYAYDGSITIKEPSYIISQKDMVKLISYVRSLN